MVQIQLSPEKASILQEVLVHYLAEMDLESGRTQTGEFQEFFKRRGVLMEGLLGRLENELMTGGKPLVSTDRLRKVDILQGLTEWELKSVCQFFQGERFPAGIILCREGENADHLYVLEKGAVSIRMQGREAVTMEAPGKTVGCSFLVPPNRYMATATTLGPADMLVIKSPDFSYLIHKSPRMGIKIMANLAQVVAGRLTMFKGRT